MRTDANVEEMSDDERRQAAEKAVGLNPDGGENA